MWMFPYFQVMKVQVHPRFVEIQSLNQHASELKNASPVTAEGLSPQVKDVNDRWNALLKGISNREVRKREIAYPLLRFSNLLICPFHFSNVWYCSFYGISNRGIRILTGTCYSGIYYLTAIWLFPLEVFVFDENGNLILVTIRYL